MDSSFDENASRWAALCSKTLARQKETLLQRERDVERSFRQSTQEIGAIIAKLSNQSQLTSNERHCLKPTVEAECRHLQLSPLVAGVDFDGRSRLLVRTRPQSTLEGAALLIAVNSEPAAITVTWESRPTRQVASELGVLFQEPVLRSVIAQLVASGRLDTLVAVVISEVSRLFIPPDKPVNRGVATHLIRRRLGQLLSLGEIPPAQCELEEALAPALRRQEQYCRDLVRIHAALGDLETDGQRQEQVYVDEFHKLCRLPRVSKITVKDNTVCVFTDTVTLEDENGHVRRIGHFRIDIHTEQCLVKIHNLDGALVTEMGVFHHPHVKDGYPCLGNASSFLSSRFAAGLITDIVPQMVEFLYSYNPGDSFRKASAWPLA
jgi:hypothetical protein